LARLIALVFVSRHPVENRSILLFCELQTEHTEGVKKLNFVVLLVDAILEVISARGTPFTVLAESVAIKQVSRAFFKSNFFPL